MHCLTALGAAGSATPAMHCLTAWGQWAVLLLQYTAALPWGSGQCNSCNALPGVGVPDPYGLLYDVAEELSAMRTGPRTLQVG